jgi:hypothetical protein
MANTPHTEFDKAAIDEVGRNLQALMKDHLAAFENLKAHWPNAGTFATAQWIERLVDDRRNAIVAHGERLNLTLEELGLRLVNVAAEFENADGENANKIKAAFDDQAAATHKDLDSHAANTESEQGNFSGGEEDQSNNNTDGDGYNDVLPGGPAGSSGDSSDDPAVGQPEDVDKPDGMGDWPHM